MSPGDKINNKEAADDPKVKPFELPNLKGLKWKLNLLMFLLIIFSWLIYPLLFLFMINERLLKYMDRRHERRTTIKKLKILRDL